MAAVAALTGLFGGGVREGDLKIQLQANPSTGYSWEVSMDKVGVVKQITSQYESSNEGNLLGAGGTQTFVFRAVKDGTVKITFTYCRPWSGETAERVVYEILSSESKLTVVNVTTQ